MKEIVKRIIWFRTVKNARAFSEPPALVTNLVPIKTIFYQIFFRFQLFSKCKAQIALIKIFNPEILKRKSKKIELGIYRRRLWLEREKSYFKICLSDRLLENRGHLKSVFDENFAFLKLHSILDDLKQPKFSQNWFFW